MILYSPSRTLESMTALFLCISWLVTPLVIAVPHPAVEAPQSAAVYLKPYSAVPTGHYNVSLLKEKMLRQEKVQWALVKDASGLSGWTPLQNLLTPLHFSSKAQLMSGSPLYTSLESSEVDVSLRIREGQIVHLLVVKNNWAQIQIKDKVLWTPQRYLYPVDKDPGYFVLKKELPLRSDPQIKSQHLLRLAVGDRLLPLEIVRPWVKVRTQNRTGYVPLNEVLTRVDIAQKIKTDEGLIPADREHLGKDIFAIHINPLWLGTNHEPVLLFEEPTASSAVIGKITPWRSLQQVDSVEQDWALSRMSGLGDVWWALPQERTIFKKLVQLPIHLIHEIKENPVFNHVRIASSKGLYRSTDGELWTPLNGFEGANPAFTFAGDGVLFVDDKISFDNGEHFAPYIHWENLLQTLQRHNMGISREIKILNVQTLNRNSRDIVLKLGLGHRHPIHVYTADRGNHWKVVEPKR